MDIPPIIQQISDICQQYDGTVYIVGGSVRDHLIQKEPKDWDLEVHNMSSRQLSNILHTIGKHKRVGNSFSVFKLNVQGEEIDIALPQSRTSDDPYMGITSALRRRDLTINAMAYDISTKTLVDPFHGKKDLKNRILRATDPETFREDPLRVLRVAQFAARFDMMIDPNLISLCLSLSLDIIPKERLQIELHKLWLKSERPSIGLLAMQTLQLFSYFPLWTSPTDANILRSVDAYAAICHIHEEPKQLIIFWICALQKTPIPQLHTFLDKLKIYSTKKIAVQKSIVSFLTHYPTLFAAPTDTAIRRFSEHCTLSFAVFVMEILFSRNHPTIEQIKTRAMELHLWDQSLPQLVQAATLMRMGYIGKDIGNALRNIREQQICGKIHTTQAAIDYLQSQTP